MKLNIFERRQLNQINKTDRLLNEGLGSKVFKYVFGRKFKKIMGDVKETEDFPEYQSILKNLYQTLQDIEDRYDSGQDTLRDLRKSREEELKRIDNLKQSAADRRRRVKELETQYGFKL